MPTRLHNAYGHVVGLYLYYNGSLEYFGNVHLPYAVLALFMFMIFNIMPLLLLCLYPCGCFQSSLNVCRLNSQILHTFMDVFQSCYKFEPYDCRYWAAFYLFLRILILAIFGLTQSAFFVVLTGITLILVVILTLVVRPYKWTVYNVIDVTVMFFLIIVQIFFSYAAILLTDFMDHKYDVFASLTLGIGLLFPLVYAFLLVFKMILPNKWIAGARNCNFLCFFQEKQATTK